MIEQKKSRKIISRGFVVGLLVLLSGTIGHAKLQVVSEIRRGLQYMEAGRFEEAIQEFKLASKRDPRNYVPYASLGNAYNALRRYEEAREAYENALLRAPNNGALYFAIAGTSVRLKDYDKAISTYNQALKVDRSLAPRTHSYLCLVYRQMERYTEALESCQKAIDLKPKDLALPYVFRGVVHYYLGKTDQALQDFEQAIRIDPAEAASYLNRAWINLYLRRGAAATTDARFYLGLKKWREEHSQYMVIVAHLGSRLANDKAFAQGILQIAEKEVDTKAWPYPVIAYLQNKMTEPELLGLATDDYKMTEARTYIGMNHVLSGNEDKAVEYFNWVRDKGDKRYFEYPLALSELKRITTK